MTPRKNSYSVHESALNGVPLFLKHPGDLRDDTMVTKVLILDDPEKINGYEAYIRKTLSKEYHVVRTMPIYLEVLKKGISKFSGIMAVASLYNIKKAEILALGDALNDLEIIREVGVGVAMKNADPGILSVADFVTRTNDDNGVAYALNHFLHLEMEEYLLEVNPVE